jgi:hypothetical protein
LLDPGSEWRSIGCGMNKARWAILVGENVALVQIDQL